MSSPPAEKQGIDIVQQQKRPLNAAAPTAVTGPLVDAPVVRNERDEMSVLDVIVCDDLQSVESFRLDETSCDLLGERGSPGSRGAAEEDGPGVLRRQESREAFPSLLDSAFLHVDIIGTFISYASSVDIIFLSTLPVLSFFFVL